MTQPANIVIPQAEQATITRLLGQLAQDCGAGHVLLLDTGGQLITAIGAAGQHDVVALGALLAGAFSSAREVAAILGERDFRSILQQGVHESIASNMIGDHWLLVVVFDRQTHIGLVKVLMRKVAEELERLLDRVLAGGAAATPPVIDVDFRASVENTIDLLFRD